MNNLYTHSIMSAHAVAYTKKQILLFLVFFMVVTAVSVVTILINGETPPPPLGNDFNLWLVVFGTGVLLPIALAFDTKVHRIRILFYTIMHTLAAMIVLFYLGSYNPMVAMWLILCIVTYIEFGKVSFYLSSIVLTATNLLFCALLPPLVGPDFKVVEYTFYTIAYTAALIVTAYIITRIMASSDQRRRELEKIRKSEATQLNKVNALLNSISDAILTLDIEGRVTSQNAASLAFFDTNESLIGRKIAGLLDIVDEKNENVDMQKLLTDVTRNQIRDDLMIHDSEQGNTRLSLQMSPIYNDESKRLGTVMMIRDITKQKTLEDEKDEFISVASHELRTPIAVAEASLSNLVLMQEKGIEPSKLKSAAETAHEEIVYLAGVVNDLSTLSRAERGVADTPEPIDMDDLFHDLYKKYEPSATKKELHLNLDIRGTLPIVEVSRLYAEEMLQNFITNAIKYTKEGSVTLIAEAVDGGVRCAVSDTGIGISKPDQKHLGERFWRSEDFRTRETNGTGLGLYVVDKLAAKVGTRIEVESRLNHGSTFSFTIPLKSANHATGKRSSFPLPES